MIQGGDPIGRHGGSWLSVPDEMPGGREARPPRARWPWQTAGPNTNGMQFFIMHGDYGGKLPKNYNIFGKVVPGMDVVNKIATAPVTIGGDGAPSKPVHPVVIRRITVHVGPAHR